MRASGAVESGWTPDGRSRRRRRGRRRHRRRLVCGVPARSGLGRVVAGRGVRPSARGPAAGPPASSGARGDAHRGAPGRMVPGLLPVPARGARASTPASSARGTSPGFTDDDIDHRPCPPGHAAEPRPGRPLDRRRRGRGPQPDPGTRDRPSAAPSPRTTATSTRPATSSPTPSPSAAGVEVHERTAFEGLVTSGDRVAGVETSRGPIATGAVVLTGGPELADVGRPGRNPCPGRRGPSPGGGDRAPPRPRPVPGADGLRRAGPASTGGPRRAGSCSA